MNTQANRHILFHSNHATLGYIPATIPALQANHPIKSVQRGGK